MLYNMLCAHTVAIFYCFLDLCQGIKEKRGAADSPLPFYLTGDIHMNIL